MELQNRKNLQFRVSTALKSIIGKDLINDKYIAVFELVKKTHLIKSEIFLEKHIIDTGNEEMP